jgi:hypothetical protein
MRMIELCLTYPVEMLYQVLMPHLIKTAGSMSTGFVSTGDTYALSLCA